MGLCATLSCPSQTRHCLHFIEPGNTQPGAVKRQPELWHSQCLCVPVVHNSPRIMPNTLVQGRPVCHNSWPRPEIHMCATSCKMGSRSPSRR
jgi:hypothetical protein